MTSEKRIVVGVEDINALTLECNQCKVRLTYFPDNIGRVPTNCPNPACNVEWYPAGAMYSASEAKLPAWLKFIASISQIRNMQKENVVEHPNKSTGFRVLLEFNETN